MLLAAAGCTDDSYMGQYDVDGFASDPREVQLEIGAPDDVKSGTVGTLADLDGATMYVTAVRRDVNPNFSDAAYFLARHRAAKVDAAAEALDFSNGGKQEKIYYPWKERAFESYEFNAVYMDQVSQDGQVYATSDALKVNFTLDGNQDVMGGHAFADNSESAIPSDADVFSYMTSVGGTMPEIYPEHLLTCLSLQLRPSVSLVDQKLVIKSIDVHAHPHAALVLADAYGNGPYVQPDGEISKIRLKDMPEITLISVESTEQQREHTVFAGKMIFPSTQNTRTDFTVQFEQYTRVEGGDYILKGLISTDCAIFHPNLLLPGCHYVVTLSVNGVTFVGGKIHLVDWNYGGGIIVDEDENPEFDGQ